MTTSARLSLEQFLELPETEPASEFVCGEVLQKPMPNGFHSLIQSWLGMMLTQLILRLDLPAVVGPEWRCVFGPHGGRRAFVPDLVYIGRGALLPDLDAALKLFEGAPDLAVEILSPDHKPRQFAEKIQFYLQYGVRLIWVIDPEQRTLTVFSPNQPSLTLKQDDWFDGGDIIPEFRAKVSEVFFLIDRLTHDR